MSIDFGIRPAAYPALHGPTLLTQLARTAEEVNLDSFWVPEHLLAVGGYLDFLATDAILEPLHTLAYVAAHTDRIRLGTGVLLAPYRHPLMLAKAAMTVQFLSNGRLILGLGTGWSPDEFRVLQIPRSQRGARTDETIDILRSAFAGDSFSYHGSIFEFENTQIDPVTNPPPELWGSGGRGIDEFGLIGESTLPPSVAKRIARLDGWLTRPQAGADQLRTEFSEVRRLAELAGRDPEEITLAKVNFCHLVDGRRPQVVAEQRAQFSRALGTQLSWERIQELHWVGSLDDIAIQIEQLLDVGVTHVVAHLLQPTIEQIELWSEGIASRFR